ncbi:hypothetical protein BDI4_580053 [Burkholderia diffusa]|nr:hypothetical protein BDI4_580053 [Burkholderia diffusa]
MDLTTLRANCARGSPYTTYVPPRSKWPGGIHHQCHDASRRAREQRKAAFRRRGLTRECLLCSTASTRELPPLPVEHGVHACYYIFFSQWTIQEYADIRPNFTRSKLTSGYLIVFEQLSESRHESFLTYF